MKILHLSSEKTWRGGEQQIAYLIAESIGHGIQCMALVRRGSEFEQWCEKQNVPFESTSFANSLDLQSASKLNALAQKEQVDLIHIHSGKSHDIYALASLLGLKTPAVLSRRVDFPVKSNPHARWKYNLKSIQKIICVSDAIRKMTQVALKDPQKAVTVHSGIDVSRFENAISKGLLRSEYNISEDSILIGNVSALAPHKDYGTFIETASKCIADGLDARFIIIGEGGERSAIEAHIQKLGLQKHVILTGFRNDISTVLPELDIFLITSQTEGLGTTVLDAFAAKVPVIATAAGGIPESVIDSETGLLCPVKDAQALRRAIFKLKENPELKSKLIANASKHLANFSKETMAKKTMAIYSDLVS